jgi:hypothetical protein
MVKQEKRFVPRVPVKWPAQVEGKIENVSSKGALVSCKDMPPLEEGLLIVIRAPEYKTMNLNGKVVWSTVLKSRTVLKSSEGDPQYGIGVQFTRMSADDREILHRMIAKLYGMKLAGKTD